MRWAKKDFFDRSYRSSSEYKTEKEKGMSPACAQPFSYRSIGYLYMMTFPLLSLSLRHNIGWIFSLLLSTMAADERARRATCWSMINVPMRHRWQWFLQNNSKALWELVGETTAHDRGGGNVHISTHENVSLLRLVIHYSKVVRSPFQVNKTDVASVCCVATGIKEKKVLYLFVYKHTVWLIFISSLLLPDRLFCLFFSNLPVVCIL